MLSWLLQERVYDGYDDMMMMMMTVVMMMMMMGMPMPRTGVRMQTIMLVMRRRL